jgi:hypothetical protein
MRTLLRVAGAILAATLAMGCGSGGDAAPAEGGSAYVDRVEAALQPAGEMAQLVSSQLRGDPAPWPSPASVEKLINEAVEGLSGLRAVSVDDPTLAAQRGRLVEAYGTALGAMRQVAGDMNRRDRPGLRSHASRFFAALRGLSSPS